MDINLNLLIAAIESFACFISSLRFIKLAITGFSITIFLHEANVRDFTAGYFYENFTKALLIDVASFDV